MDISEIDEFTSFHADLLDGVYDCVDRLVVNAYYPVLQSPGGFRDWWRRVYGTDDNLDDTHLMRLAGRFGRRARGWAKANNVPVVFCAAGDRKHELAEQALPTDPSYVGIFLIQVSKGPAAIWEVKRYGKNGLDLKKKNPLPYVNYYSFHIMDPDWGHMTIRMSSHPPFGALIMLNGHEWAERKAQQQHLDVTKEGNCFTYCSDHTALNRVTETLSSQSSIGCLSQVCDRWIYSACLCFGLDLDEQTQSRFEYSYSVYQIEQSRNLIFKSGHQLDLVYQSLIDRTRRHLDIPTLKTILGRRPRPNRNNRHGKEPKITIERPSFDLTVFKVRFGNLALKIYDKGERVLRIEAIAHNTRELRCGIVINKLPDIVAKLQLMVIRFLNVLRCSDTAYLSCKTFDEIGLPSKRGQRRLAGIDVNRPRISSVLNALMALAPKEDGFTISDLAQRVRQATGWTDKQYGNRQAAYDLAKLRGKALVEKQPKARRYRAGLPAIQTIAALVILRDQVIKPVLAGAGKPIMGRPTKHGNPLDLHYRHLQVEMRATFATLGIAL